MTTTTASSIKFQGAGGVPDMEIPIDKDGGLYVIEGHNGAGKSQALQGISDLTTGDRTMKVKHGRTKGTIEGFGASIHLGGRTTRRGDLDVVGLSSRMDIAAIVDPGYKGRAECNRAIVRSLVRMTGITPEVKHFEILAPGETPEERHTYFTEMFEAGLGDVDDLVEMAGRVKRGFDTKARVIAGQVERTQGEADALLATGADLDLDAPSDDAILQAGLEGALKAKAAWDAKAEAYAAMQKKAEAAQATVGDGGESIAEAIVTAEQLVAAEATLLEGRMIVQEEARLEVRAAEAAVLRLTALAGSAQEARHAADRSHTAAIGGLATLQASAEGWEEAKTAIDALAKTEKPDSDQAVGLNHAVQEARDLVADGVLIRDALNKREQGTKKRLESVRLQGEEDALREAGRGTDSVLSDLINAAGVKGLCVRDGEVLAMLPSETEFRPFLAMSDGERTKAALEATIPVATAEVPDGELGVIVLGQRVYQDLDPDNRRALAEYIKGRGVLVFTALPTDGEMVVGKVEA